MAINWGILGTGTIANIFAGEFDYVKDAQLKAVGSRSKEKAEIFADQNNVEKSYGSYQELVEDDELDVIYIATPHSLHYEHTMFCLENNKSVLCEKPMAVNEKQAQKMFDKAKQKNLFLMEAMWTYFFPVIKKVQEWIKDGKIGKIQLVKAQIGILPKPPRNEKGRLFNPHLAGGALLDTGIYPVSFANLLLPGQPTDLKISSKIGDTNIDEHDCLNLEYKDGSIAQLTCSIQAFINTEAYVYGSRGKIYIPKFLEAKKAELKNDREEISYLDSRESRGYNYEIEAVNQDLKNNNTINEIVPPKATIKNIRILDQARSKIGLKYPFEN